MKILGAAAAEGWSFDSCVAVANALNDQTVSIGSSLDHCHVPGRQHQSIADDVCVVGAGIHNEPGQQLLSPFPSVQDVIKRCLALLCDQDDPERAFVQFGAGDEITLVINNYGGLSPLELGALTDEVQLQLEETWKIKPVRTLVGAFETSLNAPGFCISLCNFTAAANKVDTTVPELLRLFDRPTTAVSWPNIITKKESAGEHNVHAEQNTETTDSASEDDDSITVDAQLLEKALRTASYTAIAAEPQLTKWDMVMGDGDCGEAVKTMCESVLARLATGVASKGSVLLLVTSLMGAVDDMGGTLGAIFGILLSAFYTALRSQSTEAASSSPAQFYAQSLASAVESLKKHTAAREGDRTVMDVLIPFAEAFAESGDLAAAVKVAGEKAEATRYLKPKLGRASYVGEAQELPDPGAWALYEMVWGFAKGLGIDVPRVDGP
jgi:triose/dihydroxyacetone kinase / FAD-AMP lyase (cyclizing)